MNFLRSCFCITNISSQDTHLRLRKNYIYNNIIQFSHNKNTRTIEMDESIGDLRAFVTDISKSIVRELDKNIVVVKEAILLVEGAIDELDV